MGKQNMRKKEDNSYEKLSKASNLKSHISSYGNRSSTYVFPFEKLDVWQMSVELADYVLGLLDQIPLNKHFRLVSQMEGAVTSISQNIAEGKGRQYKKEFVQYLSIAQGSLYEMITLNEVFKKRKLFSEEESKAIRDWGEEIDRKLNGLMNAIRGRKRQIQ
jgi:four helix bundle protein